ncbi:MAG: hypothetical protein IT432_06585 [Phycisphaerales bacterium]|nr:hypothetical protein [Phycisphaerales bacterium]
MTIRRDSLFPVFVLLGVGSIATAQDAATTNDAAVPAPAETSNGPDVSWRLGAFGEYHLKTDLDHHGDISLSRAGGEVGVNVPFGKAVFLDVAFREESSWYNFSNATDLGGSDSPWDGPMYDHRLISSLFVRHNDTWSYTLAGTIAWSHEDSTASESMTGGGLGIVTYSFSENFSLSAGIAASSRLERSARISPVLSIDWKVNDHWRVSGRGVGRLANRGPGLALLYSPGDTWTFGIGASYESREWRLDDQGVAPDGVAEDSRVPIEFSAVWKPSNRVSITGTIGVDAWAEYSLYDKNGDRIGDVQADPTPFVGLEAKLMF